MSTAATSLAPLASPSGFWERYVRPPPPDRPNPRWHVSPVIDMAAYHFSWAWLLIPLLLSGPDRFQDYLFLFAIMMGFNFAHRHYGLPYAYLDGTVFRTFKAKLTWLPLVCLALFLATPFLLRQNVGGSFGRSLVSGIVFFSLLWTFWHTLMQKFGILRLYMAKDSAPQARKTPAWVDRFFIFCWFPLYFSWLLPKYKDLIYANGPSVRAYLTVVIGFMEQHRGWLLLPSALVAVASIGIWLWYDWRAHRLRNLARLSAAGGTLLLSSALLWTDPIKAYIAFAFSHAVEYIVFVWAFQRRAYRAPVEHPTLMQKLLRHPYAWYIGFTSFFLVAGTLNALWGRAIFVGAQRVTLFGMSGTRWFFYYAVYESMVHFYMDGFLWKMRRKEVRANI